MDLDLDAVLAELAARRPVFTPNATSSTPWPGRSNPRTPRRRYGWSPAPAVACTSTCS